jgi:hypothetical protein
MSQHHDSASCLSSMAQQHGSSSMARYVQYTYQQVSSICHRSRMLRATSIRRVVAPPPTELGSGSSRRDSSTRMDAPKRYVLRYSLVQKMSIAVCKVASRESPTQYSGAPIHFETSDFVSSILFDLLLGRPSARTCTGMTSPSRT